MTLITEVRRNSVASSDRNFFRNFVIICPRSAVIFAYSGKSIRALQNMKCFHRCIPCYSGLSPSAGWSAFV